MATSLRTSCALVEEAGLPATIDVLEVPEPGPGQVLVKLRAAGVCHTDESVRSGALPHQLPVVLGHEGAGIVELVGSDVTSVRPGDKVIALAIQPCGSCACCARAQPESCERQGEILGSAPSFRRGDGEVRGLLGLGTFSERMTVNESALVRVESDAPFEELALLGCAVVSGVGAVVNAGAVRSGDSAAVYGCGGVGLAIVQALRIAGAAEIVAVDPIAAKRRAAIDCGATRVVDPSAGDPVAQVLEVTAGRGVDVAFEAVGRGATIRQAFRSARQGGHCVALGVGGDDDFSLPPTELVLSGKTLVGSRYGSGHPRVEVLRCLRLLEKGLLSVARLISDRLPLSGVDQAFERMRRGEALRTVLVFA